MTMGDAVAMTNVVRCGLRGIILLEFILNPFDLNVDGLTKMLLRNANKSDKTYLITKYLN